MLKELKSPYGEWRPGQSELARSVYEAVLDGEVIVADYPTGFGKTVAALVGAIEAAKERELRIFYAIRTKNEIQAPLRELLKMGLCIGRDVSILLNKRDLCLLKSARTLEYDEFLKFCLSAMKENLCPYSQSLLQKEKLMPLAEHVSSFRDLITIAKSEKICPYVLAKALAENALVIIGAYNYLFDPLVRDTLLRDVNISIEKLVVIADEAHNLHSSVATMLSCELKKSWIIKARREIKPYPFAHPIGAELHRLACYLNSLEKRLAPGEEIEVNIDEFLSVAPSYTELRRIAMLIERDAAKAGIPIRSYTGRIADFLERISRQSPFHVLIASRNGGFSVKHVCVMPKQEIGYVLNSSAAAVLISGTMPPLEYLTKIYGIQKRIKFMKYKNPYAKNVRIIALKGISSRYTERVEANFRKMASIISNMFRHLSHGVLMVVFPSYTMMKNVRVYIREKPIFVEREDSRLSELKRRALCEDKLLALCVARGKLIEGIEIRRRGQSLIKAVVVAGLPVPEPSIANRRLFQLLTSMLKSREDAWHFTYILPAVIQVLQAIGRGVRSPSDKLFVGILDERVLEPRTLTHFTEHGLNVIETDSPATLFKEFRDYCASEIREPLG